jgi:hypothetical protein
MTVIGRWYGGRNEIDSLLPFLFLSSSRIPDDESEGCWSDVNARAWP